MLGDWHLTRAKLQVVKDLSDMTEKTYFFVLRFTFTRKVNSVSEAYRKLRLPLEINCLWGASD